MNKCVYQRANKVFPLENKVLQRSNKSKKLSNFNKSSRTRLPSLKDLELVRGRIEEVRNRRGNV